MTPLLNNYSPKNAPSEHLPKMVDEFMYLDAHLTKLTNKKEVERFKYYVKKRINFYLNLLKLRKDKDTLNEYAMMLIKKISKKLDSQLTKVYRYIRRGGTENAEKYIKRSKVSPNTITPNTTVFSNNNFNSPPLPPPLTSLKERTMIHLKRYLAKIPPKNIEELSAFKDLFKDRMKAEKLENLEKNVRNIKNTISLRMPDYMSPSNYITRERAQNEAKRHLEIVERKRRENVAGRKIGSELKLFSQKKKEKDQLKKAKQKLEGYLIENRLAKEAHSASAKRKKESANRRKASVDRKKAAVRLQSMRRMRLGRQARQARKREIIENRMVQKAFENDKYSNALQKSLERRKAAIRKGQEKQKEREILQKQANINRSETEFGNFLQGKKMSQEARQRAAAMAIESAWKQGPDRADRLAVKTQTMARSPRVSTRKPSSEPHIVYVRPKGQYVNVPSFNVNDQRGKNKKRMIVVRSDPKEESYMNMLKRLSGDLFGY